MDSIQRKTQCPYYKKEYNTINGLLYRVNLKYTLNHWQPCECPIKPNNQEQKEIWGDILRRHKAKEPEKDQLGSQISRNNQAGKHRKGERNTRARAKNNKKTTIKKTLHMNKPRNT